MALLIRCPVSDYVLMPVIRQHRVSKKILLQQSANVRLGRLCLRLTNAGNMTWTTKTVVVVRLTYKVNESGEAFNAEVATAEAHLCTSSAVQAPGNPPDELQRNPTQPSLRWPYDVCPTA